MRSSSAGKILHQHFQTTLAAVDDLPQFGALIVGEAFVGEFDPRLYDVAVPGFGARVDEFGRRFGHALVPPACRIWRYNAT